MTPRLRKFALTAHVTSSVGWLGTVAAFQALAIAAVSSPEPQLVRGFYWAMELVGVVCHRALLRRLAGHRTRRLTRHVLGIVSILLGLRKVPADGRWRRGPARIHSNAWVVGRFGRKPGLAPRRATEPETIASASFWRRPAGVAGSHGPGGVQALGDDGVRTPYATWRGSARVGPQNHHLEPTTPTWGYRPGPAAPGPAPYRRWPS